MLHWLVAFAFTQLIEVPIYMRALRGRAFASFGASAITHPVVWFVIPDAWRALYLAAIRFDSRFVIASPLARYLCMVLVAEAFAVGVEAIYLRALGVKRALTWSFAANAASVILGLVARSTLGWP